MQQRRQGKPKLEEIGPIPSATSSATPIGMHVSAARLSELIGEIYDCVLDPARWETTLEGANRELSFSSSALGVIPLRAGAQVLNIGVGLDPEWIEKGKAYAAESIALWGGEERARHFPLDEPIVGSRTAGYAGRSMNRYFTEILKPRGIVDGILVPLAREPSLLGYVGFNRHRSAGAVGDSEIEALRLLGPHFRRAVTISNLFDLKAIEAASFASVLDGLTFGVIMVDERLGVVHANPVAEEMLAARDPIELRKGVLAMREKDATAALERAVRQASLDEAGMGTRGIGIPARRRQGEPCVVHVLPLARGEMRRGLVRRAAAALFVAPAEGRPHVPSDALALLYDLTPAETRILELVCNGVTQKEISDRLGIAPSTVKTHVLHLFDKTGCTRQVGLVRLAAGLSMPV